MPSKLHLNICLLNTGAGLPITNSKLILGNWKHKLNSHHTPNLQSELKKQITLRGPFLLFVRVGNLDVKIWFGIVRNVTVDIALGTPFIDRYIRGTVPEEQKVVPWHSVPVPMHSKPATV